MAVSERIDLDVPPGFVRTGTPLSARKRWYSGSLVRWRDGVMQAVGGWEAATLSGGGALSLGGRVRSELAWAGRDGNPFLALSTPTTIRVYRGEDLRQAYSGGTSFAATSMDNFGGDLVYDVSAPNSGINYLDTTGVESGNGFTLTNAVRSLGGSPVNNAGVVVTPERFVVALGADGDPSLVRWCSQGDPDVWDPLDTNTAGDLNVPSNGGILAGRRGKGETLIWTETDLLAMRYTTASIGGVPLIYAITNVGVGGAISHRSMVVSGSRAFWMGHRNFWQYNGYTSRLPCAVSDYVFQRLNYAEADKVWVMKLDDFSEVTWFYPSGNNTECDGYVTFNYENGTWYFGDLGRAGGVGADLFPYPLLGDSANNTLWIHEKGSSHQGAQPFAETGILDIAKGKRLMFVDEIYPDDVTTGAMFSLLASDSPDGAETEHGAYNAAAQINVRIEARHLRFRVELSADARYGLPRLDARQAGER